uniref:Uncharacterized protein AlNc14C571G12179 n=1 Tax=Albugo laibachii Nc14 TaxID=890382 RepID=F0X185_9STRA|nr:conserved hypothetical protein [Albugo laibachii Nc14]|eukprot:CCA27543.1 conserved hypothetical protein [Albugo laibachii Nc14]
MDAVPPHVNESELYLAVVLYTSNPKIFISCVHVAALPHKNDVVIGVFLGSEDGLIISWIFYRPSTPQINILIPQSTAKRSRIQGITTTFDAFDEAIILAIDREGGISKWNVFTGLSIRSIPSLASSISPIYGINMLNKQYALIHSQESRMVVLDAWNMRILPCADTSQEQLRQSVFTSSLPSTSQCVVWDCIIISLGTQGLINFFLWSQPHSPQSFRWRKDSCWILSWADDADDITCSQSTSLMEGDNMNPQTALMRSIQSSYFPIAMAISPNASLLLFVWNTRWAVLYRQWLCKTDDSDEESYALAGMYRGTLQWRGGVFLSDENVALWTDEKIFSFDLRAIASDGGKFFIFTKALDQFVPRSFYTHLKRMHSGHFVQETRGDRVASLTRDGMWTIVQVDPCGNIAFYSSDKDIRMQSIRCPQLLPSGNVTISKLLMRIDQTQSHLDRIPLIVRGDTEGNIRISVLGGHRDRDVVLDGVHDGRVSCLAHIPNGEDGNWNIFSGCEFGFLALLSIKLHCGLGAKTQCPLLNVSIISRWHHHRGVIRDISIASDHRHIASIGSDNRVIVYLCNENTFTCLYEFAQPQPSSLEWHLDTAMLYITSHDAMLRVWSLSTGILERIVPQALILSAEATSKTQFDRVECIDTTIGDSNVHLITFSVAQCAREIKKAWESNVTCASLEKILLSFFLSWNASSSVDQACVRGLGVQQPQCAYGCALVGDAHALTLPLLESSDAMEKLYRTSSTFSANIALSVVSICMNVMDLLNDRVDEEFHLLWSQLITQHSVVLPEVIPSYMEPSLELLATFTFCSCPFTSEAARTLVDGAIRRQDITTRHRLTSMYTTQLDRISREDSSEALSPLGIRSIRIHRTGPLIVLLSLFGTCFPGEISPSTARKVCDVLVMWMRASSLSVVSLSIDLLTRGLMLFRPHFMDVSALITQLFMIDATSPQTSSSAMTLLLALGGSETAFVLRIVHEIASLDRSDEQRQSILRYIVQLIHLRFVWVARHLGAVVDILMTCLDPTKAERRRKCMEKCMAAVCALVERFPMVDFHRSTQRFAHGTMEAEVIVYDFRSGSKWRVFEGHGAAVSAVCFRPDGNVIASYAAREARILWWNSAPATLLGSMLKLQQICLKECKLQNTIEWRGDGDWKRVLRVCRLMYEDSENVVLIREDGNKVQFVM